MSAQESLFDAPHPRPVIDVPLGGRSRNTDPESSKRGERKVNLPRRCQEVLAGLYRAGRPITSADLHKLGFVDTQFPNAINNRCKDLVAKGLVRWDLSDDGHLWSLTDEGRQAAT